MTGVRLSMIRQAVVGCLLTVAVSACGGGETYRDVVQDFSDRPVGEITPQLAVGQSFVPNHNRLSGVAVMMATWGRANNCDVVLHLRPEGTDRDISTQQLKCSAIQDNSWVHINFTPIKDSRGRKFVFLMESANAAPGNAVTGWMASVQGIYPDGNLLLNGKPAPGALRFITFHQ